MKELREFFDKELKPRLDEFEARRQLIARKLYLLGAGCVVLLVIVAWLVWRQGDGDFVPTLLIGAIPAGLIGFGGWWFIMGDYVSDFKTQVVSQVVRFCDENLRYSPEEGIAEHEYMATRLFLKDPDKYKSEDLVQGKLGATSVRFSEVHSQYKTTSTDSKGKRKTEWHTIFRGLLFMADFHKDFKGSTLVLPDRAEKMFGWLGKKLQSVTFKTEKLVSLEDPEFERLFVVQSTDQVEARYILSPAFMQRMVDFRKRQQHDVYVSFTHSNVNVGISSNKNMFEPRVFQPVNTIELVEEYLADLQLATGIVEDLNLNTRIWSKS